MIERIQITTTWRISFLIKNYHFITSCSTDTSLGVKWGDLCLIILQLDHYQAILLHLDLEKYSKLFLSLVKRVI